MRTIDAAPPAGHDEPDTLSPTTTKPVAILETGMDFGGANSAGL